MAASTNPLTYNAYITQVGTLAVVNLQTVSGVVQGVDAWFNNLVPAMLNYAELRIQRDLDLLPLLSSNTYTLSNTNNLLQVPVGDFVTVQDLVVGGVPLLPTTKEFLQNVYGPSGTKAQPLYFAMVGGDSSTAGNTYNNIIVGPYPDQNYPVVVWGTIRMPSLYYNATVSLANSGTTFISTYLPDLLVTASLIFVSLFQRNFGAATDNSPEMGVTYETQYQALLKSALVEEARKKFQSTGWQSESPPVIAGG